MKNSINIENKITDLLTILLSNSAGAYVSMFAAYVQLWHRKQMWVSCRQIQQLHFKYFLVEIWTTIKNPRK